MSSFLFYLDPANNDNLQIQIRQLIVNAILDGHIPPGSSVPSCRQMAKQLSVSRNTVVLTYERLVDDGVLSAKQRSGYFVSEDFQPSLLRDDAREATQSGSNPEWQQHLQMQPSRQENIAKPANWRSYDYPFIYGQLDHELFPFNEWRECTREANSRQAVRNWQLDRFDNDDALLLEQLHTRVLPNRGVWAETGEILGTMGTQHSLYLVSQLLLTSGVTIGIEDPGYVDARNIFELSGAEVVPIPLDEEGIVVDERIEACDVVYVTPSHQSPTTLTMSLGRRHELLARAHACDFLIIEDDYESETNFLEQPTPALKSLDTGDRVIYISSLSKILAPGLRLGYLVAPRPFIEEARALRRLMLRHPPSNNQRTVALFLAHGHYDTLVYRLRRIYQERWHTMRQALGLYLPDTSHEPTFGGASFWICGPPMLDSNQLARDAAREGILIEPGDVHFAAANPPRNYFRLGFASIAEERIEPGIRALTQLIDKQVESNRAN